MIVVSAVRRIVLTAEVLALFVEVMIEMRRLARQMEHLRRWDRAERRRRFGLQTED